MVKAVLFDVDFTLALPGPELGPEGYRRLGERHGLTLDPERYDEARRAAHASLQRHPELEHDDEIWVAFTEQIVRGMGGDADGAYECAVELVARLGVTRQVHAVRGRAAGARGASARTGSSSASSRTAAETSTSSCATTRSRSTASSARAPSGGRSRIRRSSVDALALLEVEPEDAAMVGDSYEDDIEGARALGLRAFLLDRDGRYPGEPERLTDLYALPAALGLTPLEKG